MKKITGISITEDLIMHKVKLYQAGALLVAEPTNAIKHSLCPHTEFTQQNNKKRGKIQGFSRRSCGRLRKALIRYDFSHCITMALTAPPYAPRSPESVLNWIRDNMRRIGKDVAIVWRKEVTRAGTVHYHLIVWASDLKSAFERLVEVWANGLFPKDFDYLSIIDDIYNSLKSIRNETKFMNSFCRLGILHQLALGNTRIDPAQVEKVPYKNLCEYCRAKVREVNEHQDTNYQEVGINYIKYILDHTSKHKDYQSKTVGRAWGIINRAAIPMSSYSDTELSPKQYAIFLRILGKMSRVKDTRDRNLFKPFGYKLTHRKQYNCARVWGQSPQFLAPAALQRALDFVKQC